MEVAGFGLAIIAQARTLLTSIKNRIENFRKGPETFRTLSDNVSSLEVHISDVESLLRKFPNAVPAEISNVYEKRFTVVCDSLLDSNRVLEESSKAFAGSSSNIIDKAISKAIRTFRATELSVKMSAVEVKIEKASNELIQLTYALSNALQNQELQDILVPKIDNLNIGETAKDVYRPLTNTPALTDTVSLDFDARDERGTPPTPEGILKQSVLANDSSTTVTAAAGVMKSAYGIVGMAGVGKTVALLGLAHDKDIQNRFPDGVLFMTLGQGATEQTVTRELVKIVTLTGGTTIVGNVQGSSSLQEAVDYAVPWFAGRICLFLVDNIWPTNDRKTGFLTDLRQLLRESPESRMGISTRSVLIAQVAGSVVKFGTRDPLGTVSEKIFLAHATVGVARKPSVGPGHKLRDSVLKILSICGGLPIALSVTGSAVAFLTSGHGDFERACDAYAVQLEKKRSGLGDDDTVEGKSLNAGILLSLEYLDGEFLKWKAKSSLHVEHSISDLYTSLCVLTSQAWVPVSALGRLWQLEEDEAMDVVNLFCEMSLATLHLRRPTNGSQEAGIVLHDLHLEFCQRQAEKRHTASQWHTKLLNGYIETSGTSRLTETSTLMTETALLFTPRPWWSEDVPEDGYIHANIARHLFCSGQGMELAALLLDARWSKLRAKIGGILALQTDFELLERFTVDWECARKQETRAGEVRRSFGQILKEVRLSWGSMSKGIRAFQFQACGRLLSLRKLDAIVDTYLRSLESYTPKPYLLPVNPFFPDRSGAQIMEIQVGGFCHCVRNSPCGQYMAGGAGLTAWIAETSTGKILQRLSGHTGIVWCIAFSAGSKTIISGAEDGKVMVWAWESSASPVRVLEGHSGVITGVAVSGDGEKIFSASMDRTVRIWDASTGIERGKISQSHRITCFALCAEGRRIAIGLENGSLKVWDSFSNDELFNTKAHDRIITSVAFSPNGMYLATGSSDRTVGVWNAQTPVSSPERLEGHKHVVTSVTFTADGAQIASSSIDGTVRLWDVASRECVGISPRTNGWLEGVSFTPDGERITCGSSDGIVHIWDAVLGEESKEQSSRHTRAALGVSISPNGLRVASSSEDETVRLWDARTGEQIGVPFEGHTHVVFGVSFSPDGRQVASVSADGTLRLWNTETYSQIGDPIQGHIGYVRCVSWSCDGLRIISGGSDTSVRVWNVQTQEQMGDVLQGHTEAVISVSESVDGHHIVSREYRRTIIWNTSSRAIVWKSEKLERESENCITLDEAEKIIRSCGQEAPLLWPKSLSTYTAELYWENGRGYSNLLGEKTLLAHTGMEPYGEWRYHAGRKFVVAALNTGLVAMCTLITK